MRGQDEDGRPTGHGSPANRGGLAGRAEAAAGETAPPARDEPTGSAETFAAAWPARMRQVAGWLLNKTSVHGHRLTAEAFTAVGARKYHYPLLASLAEFGPSSQASLGRRLGFDRSDVAAMVNELTQAGYVERAQDPADRRRNIIAITAAGVERLDQFDALVAAVQDRLLAPLTPAERAEFVRLLTRVLDHHAASPAACAN